MGGLPYRCLPRRRLVLFFRICCEGRILVASRRIGSRERGGIFYRRHVSVTCYPPKLSSGDATLPRANVDGIDLRARRVEAESSQQNSVANGVGRGRCSPDFTSRLTIMTLGSSYSSSRPHSQHSHIDVLSHAATRPVPVRPFPATMEV